MKTEMQTLAFFFFLFPHYYSSLLSKCVRDLEFRVSHKLNTEVPNFDPRHDGFLYLFLLSMESLGPSFLPLFFPLFDLNF